MRIMTSYAYTLEVKSVDEAAWRFQIYRDIMDDWLREQRISDPREDSPVDAFIQLKRRDVSHDGAAIDGFMLKQPVLESSHVLHTRFDLAVANQSLALFLQFSVERRTSRIAPVSYQVSCPRALQTILDAGNWKSGHARVQPRCRRIFGQDAGRMLRAEIENHDRTLPIVLLANFSDNEPLGDYQKLTEPYSDEEWEDFINRVEDDLGGVALLAELDGAGEDALLPTVTHHPLDGQLTRLDRRGPVLQTRNRSHGMCGAIVRIIWPLGTDEFDPSRHPAWAPYELFADPDSDIFYNEHGHNTDPPDWMGTFERDQLMLLRRFVRDQIYEQAALQPVPSLIDDIRQQFTAAERERLASNNDFNEWQRMYEDEIDEKEQEIAERRGEVETLHDTVDRLQSVTDEHQATIAHLKFQLNQQGNAIKDSGQAKNTNGATDPSSVAEAIDIAEDRCELLEFGPNARKTVKRLDPKAGPPSKILDDLMRLNECCRTLTRGPLGQDVLKWLKNSGLSVSQESETRENKHKDLLTFETANGEAVLMSNHITYKGNTLNRQVRIYFCLREADSSSGHRFDIGYVGPKVAED